MNENNLKDHINTLQEQILVNQQHMLAALLLIEYGEIEKAKTQIFLCLPGHIATPIMQSTKARQESNQ